ncbi:serine/threonine protein kinase [Nonomuraea sp. H19]|uniref:serine/threonine protein kinase n=1 Tax=Nonomuraea sp. H19 TaxID=3452206 RepID=UPI003F8B23B3
MPSITELRPGDPTHLGGYEIRGRLGEGGQGVVYLGADAQGGQAAVKWLRPHLAGDAVAAERFAREAAVSQRVAPFCTAKVLATGVHEERPFIVSEYVDGPSLQQAVTKEGPRTESALHRLAIGTATALAAIHQAGIVHRDFGPGNVLLGGEGPRVIDFGIARALDATSTITTTPVGTPAFMAPEQILAHPAGPAADMFAWASTMVFAASGAGPFQAENVPAIIQRVLYGEPDLARLSGPLRELVAACLSKDPARRPTAEQVILRLLEHPATSNPDELQQAAAVVGGGAPAPWQPPGAPPPGASPPGTPPLGMSPPGPGSAAWLPPGSAAAGSQPPGSGGPGPQPFGLPPPSQPAAGHPSFQPPPFQQAPQQLLYGPPQRPARSGKGWVIGASAAAVALVAAVAIVVVSVVDVPVKKQAQSGQAPTAGTPSTLMSPTPTSSPVPTANLTTVKLSGADATVYENPADPVRLTTYLVRDAKTKYWVYYARDSATGPFTKYPQALESILSPDGRYLVQRPLNYVEGYDTVDITDKTTGERFSVKTSRKPLSAYVQGWSRDSTRVLLNVGTTVKDVWQSTGFAIVDVTAREATVASLREGSLKGIRYGFDPTGTGVVAMAINADQQALRFFDAQGQRVRRIPNVGSGIAESLFSPTGKKFVTDCPGLSVGVNCVYDSQSGAELRRIESPCSSAATWYDDNHLACWVRPDGTSGNQQIQVIDFSGKMVRLLMDVPSNATNVDVVYTYTHRN